MIYTANTTFEVNKTRILKRLKIEPNTNVYDYALGIFDDLVALAKKEMNMTHCFSIRPNQLTLDLAEVDCCEKLIFCFSSCTNAIVDTIAAMLDRGDFLEGYILNDLSNEVLFNASNQMNHQIEDLLGIDNYCLTTRYSPGENNFQMEYQETLLNALKEEISLPEVELTESYMITPEKSMLYLYGADTKIKGRPVEHDCNNCSNVECFFRCVE